MAQEPTGAEDTEGAITRRRLEYHPSANFTNLNGDNTPVKRGQVVVDPKYAWPEHPHARPSTSDSGGGDSGGESGGSAASAASASRTSSRAIACHSSAFSASDWAAAAKGASQDAAAASLADAHHAARQQKGGGKKAAAAACCAMAGLVREVFGYDLGSTSTLALPHRPPATGAAFGRGAATEAGTGGDVDAVVLASTPSMSSSLESGSDLSHLHGGGGSGGGGRGGLHRHYRYSAAGAAAMLSAAGLSDEAFYFSTSPAFASCVEW